jgi:uncharacterized protein
MSELAWRRPDPALLLLRRGQCLVGLALPGLAATAVVASRAGGVQALAALLLTAVTTCLALTSSSQRYAAWGWAERDDALLVRRGVLVHRLTLVPFTSVQYVDVTSGPVDRRLGIARVTLHTAAAAADASIPGLRSADALGLRDRLAALGEARAAGL